MSDTLAESRTVHLRIDEPEYEIDMSATPCTTRVLDSADYLADDKVLP